MDNLYFFSHNINGDIMTGKLKLFLKTFIICSVACAVFVGTGYLYLSKSIKQADNEVLNIPYRQTLSENKGILLVCNGENVFFYLDFIDNKLVVSLSPDKARNGEIYGYSHNYTLEGNDTLISNIIDCVGGVELLVEDGKLRYTGLQVVKLLKQSNSKELRRDIIKDTCKKIAEYGIGTDFFSTIVNKSKTDLKFSECYLWREYLPQLCENLNIID